MKTMKEYYNLKHNFFAKHGGLDEVFTSSMDEYGTYHKEYVCVDGSMLYEVNGPAWYDVNIQYEVNGVTIRTNKTEKKKFFRTESWNSDNATSEYFIEAWN